MTSRAWNWLAEFGAAGGLVGAKLWLAMLDKGHMGTCGAQELTKQPHDYNKTQREANLSFEHLHIPNWLVHRTVIGDLFPGDFQVLVYLNAWFAPAM